MPTEVVMSVKNWNRAPLGSNLHSYRVVRLRKAIEVVLDDQDQHDTFGCLRFTFNSFGGMNAAHRQLLTTLNWSYIREYDATLLLNEWKNCPDCHVSKVYRVSR